MATIKSKRTKRFKEQLSVLPSEIQDAVCFIDGDTYVWTFIGHHRDFDREFG